MRRKIILFELNEVPNRVLNEFCRWQPDSVLARRLPECFRYSSKTDDVGGLSPWITWPSLHRGVNNEKHLLSDFGQSTTEVDKQFPPLWGLLASQGLSTGVCGSLHTYPMPARLDGYTFYLPDTFAADSESFPKPLEAFQAFNLSMARDSPRNVSLGVPWKAAMRLARVAPRLGFTPSTVLSIGRQLVEERVHAERRTRRRVFQSVLAFDVFMRQLEVSRPDFATFFTNHVASAMHRYWAAAFPGDYTSMDYPQDWIASYRDEIRFAMQKTNDFFERLTKFVDANPDYMLWIATSMGQAATRARPVETQLYVTSPQTLMSALGVPKGDWELRPAMLPQFNVAVGPGHQPSVVSKLKTLRIGGHPVSFREAEEGFISMDFGQEGLSSSSAVELEGRPCTLQELGLTNTEIQDKSGTSAYHIPEGCLLVYDPRRRGPKTPFGDPVSTLEVAPAILRTLGVSPPAYMRDPSGLAAVLAS